MTGRATATLLEDAYWQRVDGDKNYAISAQRWRDHLKVYPQLDPVSRQNIAALIAANPLGRLVDTS